MRGQAGHGFCGARPSGGRAKSSKLVRLLQCMRSEVPMQSVPVSPPPITITCLSFASMRSPLQWLLSLPSLSVKRWYWFLRKNSMAKCTPSRSRPGRRRSLGVVEPTARSTASWPFRRSAADRSTPTSTLHLKAMPSASRRSSLRWTFSLASFMLGMPYMSKPPGFSSRSYTVTVCPRRLSMSAAASPAGPDPMTATVLPVRTAGGCASTQPSRNAFSMMAYSAFLMVTGESMSPATQAPSHGAGHTRPVNSGKLLVEARLRYASFQRPS
mmetsp:Transcript_25909/g.86846  ORF Transcript_25909/g.86846 Transcript_25909/m.86846 type:complete len:270 (-) Transcript_25909:385-1194(-)